MPLSRPAMISAFVCPGLGQWAAGRKTVGALLVVAAVSTAGSPFVRFFWVLVHPPPCDLWLQSAWECTRNTVSAAWTPTWPVLLAAIPAFAAVWTFAVWHANRLRIP